MGQALLLTIPQQYQEPVGGWRTRCAPDGRFCAYVASKNGSSVAVFNGLEGAPYEEIDDITFDSTASRIAYKARIRGAWIAVVDRKESPQYADIKELAFYGARLSYQASSGGGGPAGESWKMIFGDHISAAFNSITLTVSKDQQSFAYYGMTYAQPLNTATVVLNGTRVGDFNDVSEMSFLPEGRFAFVGRVGSFERGRSTLFIDQKPVAQHDDVRWVRTSTDGRNLAYVARTGTSTNGRSALVLNGKVVRTAADIDFPVFLQDGSSLAFVERSNDRRSGSAVIGDRIGPAMSISGQIAVSPDGKRHAYPVRSGDGTAIVVDGVLGPVFDEAYSPQFSPDSAHLAYMAGKDGAYRVVVDSVPGPPFDSIDSSSISWRRFGIAYRGRDGDEPETLVVGTSPTRLEVMSLTEPTVDDGGKTLTVVSQENREVWLRTMSLPAPKLTAIRPENATRVPGGGWTRVRVDQEKNDFAYTVSRQLTFRGRAMSGLQLPSSVNRLAISPVAGGRYAVAMPLDQSNAGSAFLLNVVNATARPISLKNPPILFTSWSPTLSHLLLASYYESQSELHLVSMAPFAVNEVAVPVHSFDEEHRFDTDRVRWESSSVIVVPVSVNCNPYSDRPCTTDRSVVTRRYTLVVNALTNRASIREAK